MTCLLELCGYHRTKHQQFTTQWFPPVKHCSAFLISSSFVSMAMGWLHFQEMVRVQHQLIFSLEYMTLLVLFWLARGIPLRWGHRCESLAVLQVMIVVQLSFTNCGSAAVERRDCRRLLVTWNTQPGVNVENMLSIKVYLIKNAWMYYLELDTVANCCIYFVGHINRK